MSEGIIGVLDYVTAFEYDKGVYVVGAGKNPTSGWGNALLRCYGKEREADLVFVQYPPEGMVLQVITPFVATFFMEPNPFGKSLTLLCMKDGGPGYVNVPIRSELSASDLNVVQSTRPVSVYTAYDPRLDAKEEKEFEGAPFIVQPKGLQTAFSRVIAGFDNSLDCCDLWPPRCRGSRNEWILDVHVQSPQDIGKAVEECFQVSTIAAALVAVGAVVVTGGAALSAAIDAFLVVLKPCLLAKLTNVVSITVRHKHRCK